ncbi:hypothetical protein Pla8534_18600 [Lignipirellula cremea]|uniref:Uncharacterized protein n=1 Tax=Lignipirellula cremea TaxID=2528010 RepID=A0A518DQH5_9BACT|nr:hypothetical protein Pla8534_18600 [Lignipirellula cremea]
MTSCDLDTSVPDWVNEHPLTLTMARTIERSICDQAAEFS